MALDYNLLAKEIHNNAVEKGFWEEPRDMEEMLMLAVSELAEGLEEDRDKNPLVYFMHKGCKQFDGMQTMIPTCAHCTPKPEGLVIELADCIIRLFDTLGSITEDVLTEVLSARVAVYAAPAPALNSAKLFRISRMLTNSHNADGETNTHRLAKALDMCTDFIVDLGWDPEVAIALKMQYNASRAYKHGKGY